MPDFKEQADIVVQPGDADVPYEFNIPPCSSATANDGAIPYGTNIASVVVTAHKSDGTVATGLVASSSEASNVVTVLVSFPSTVVGTYHFTFVCTLDSGAIIEFDFNRVKVRNK